MTQVYQIFIEETIAEIIKISYAKLLKQDMMKNLFLLALFICICMEINAQGLTYTPFFRENTPTPKWQPSLPQQHPSYARQAKASVECVKNCIAILPDGEEPIVVYVHVKRFSDSIRTLGFLEPDSGTFFMFGNDSDGLEKLVPTKAVDSSMAEEWPYFVVFNTNAGEVICFLPNLYISKVAVYDFENMNRNN